jgi:polysaccharide biosynthesis protein PslG
VILIIASIGLHVWNFTARAPWSEVAQRPAVAAEHASPHIAVNPYSVNTFLANEVEPWKRQKTMEMIERAGIGWIKQQFLWSEIEPTRGSYWDAKYQQDAWKKYDDIVALAEAHGVRVIARIDHTPEWARQEGTDHQTPPTDVRDYGNFVEAFVKRYQGRVQYIQVWNEPNLSREWGGDIDPDGYFALLQEAYTRAKAVDPNVVILSAPMAMTKEHSGRAIPEFDYWTRLFELGVQDYFDVMTATGYGLDQAPETPPGGDVINLRRIEILRELAIASGAGDKAIWLTEYGWNAAPETMPEERLDWRRVSEEDQAEWTARGISWMDQNWPWFGVASIWYFRQVGNIPPDAPEYYFRMVDHEFTPRLVYLSVQQRAIEREVGLAGTYGPLESPIRARGQWARFDAPASPFGQYIESQRAGVKLTIHFSGTDVSLLIPETEVHGIIYVQVNGRPVSGDHVEQDDAGRSLIDLSRADLSGGRVAVISGYKSGRPQQPHTLTIELGSETKLAVAGVEIDYVRSYIEFSLVALLGMLGFVFSGLLLRR